ncbi:unnamed protein product [Schistosoma margrebowiei]|uniref:Uncharacterized protein n=1 Tax=Schistosoma margrebowiei TaxID=48269 RepID=A0AA84ZF17_9TREM|nr:unnamed protein product [Schistosoma margrebowiei]
MKGNNLRFLIFFSIMDNTIPLTSQTNTDCPAVGDTSIVFERTQTSDNHRRSHRYYQSIEEEGLYSLRSALKQV